MTQKGKLYVVATPIGNLTDLSFRALDILKSCDLILAEDTRVTAKLLNHYDVDTPMLSYRDQNHDKVVTKLIDLLDTGNNLALTSDSGTPVVSDPGFRLVRELKALGYKVESIPGPNSIISALSISGLPTDKFVFLGFLPKSNSKKKELINNYGNLDSTVIIFESPFRVKSTLKLIQETLDDRTVSLVKDLTKMHEKVITQKLSEFANNFDNIKEKGEYTILIAKEGYSLNG